MSTDSHVDPLAPFRASASPEQRADIAARLDARLRPNGRAKVSGLGFLCVSYDYGTHWSVLEDDRGDRYLAWLEAGGSGTIWDMEDE